MREQMSINSAPRPAKYWIRETYICVLFYCRRSNAYRNRITDWGTEVKRIVGRGRSFFGVAAVRACQYLEGMATLDWSQCPAVESVPGKRSGAWVFKDTRMPVSTVFENLESGASIEEIMEWFGVTREQIVAVLDFAARSLEAPAASQSLPSADARSL